MNSKRAGRLYAFALTFVVVWLAGAPARAVEYSNPINVEDEDGIYQLYENELITADERDRLVDLFRQRVDLNTATRDDLYELPGVTYKIADRVLKHRKKKGGFGKPEEVRKIKGVRGEVWEQIRAFVDAGRPLAWLKDLQGRVRFRANGVDRKNAGDMPNVVANPDDPPPAFLHQADFSLYKKYALGWSMLLEEQLAPVAFAPAAGGQPGYWLTDGLTYTPGLGNFRAYASMRAGLFDIIVGHYRVGFGQGLAFDNTGRVNPWGWVKNQSVYEAYNDAGYSFARGQRGVAVSAKDIGLGRGLALDLAAFVSYSDEDAYQYDVGYRDEDDEYHSFPVYQGFKDDEGANKLSFQTLPRVYHELLGGGAARLRIGERHHVGVIGYGGRLFFASAEDALLSPSSPFPEDRLSYGAFGLDMGTGVGIWSLFGEVALTDAFASALYLRSLLEWDAVDLDISVRHYETDYDNPHSRGKADADEYRGNRDRDERGARARLTTRLPGRVRLSAAGDVWQRMSEDVWNAQGSFRADWSPWRFLKLSGYLYVKDKDLGAGGREQSYDTTSDIGRGMRWDWALQVTGRPMKGLVLTAYYKRRLADASVYDSAFEPTHYGWFRAAWAFLPGWRTALRFKIYDEDTLDTARGDRYWEVYGEIEARLFARVYAKVRYTHQRGMKTAWKKVEGEDVAFSDVPLFHHVRGQIEVQF